MAGPLPAFTTGLAVGATVVAATAGLLTGAIPRVLLGAIVLGRAVGLVLPPINPLPPPIGLVVGVGWDGVGVEAAAVVGLEPAVVVGLPMLPSGGRRVLPLPTRKRNWRCEVPAPLPLLTPTSAK